MADFRLSEQKFETGMLLKAADHRADMGRPLEDTRRPLAIDNLPRYPVMGMLGEIGAYGRVVRDIQKIIEAYPSGEAEIPEDLASTEALFATVDLIRSSFRSNQSRRERMSPFVFPNKMSFFGDITLFAADPHFRQVNATEAVAAVTQINPVAVEAVAA